MCSNICFLLFSRTGRPLPGGVSGSAPVEVGWNRMVGVSGFGVCGSVPIILGPAVSAEIRA